MDYEFAPMEGITDWRYRRAHSRAFSGVDRYYMPFLSPGQGHAFTRREKEEIDPAHNAGVRVVPQLLTRRAEDFLWAAGELAARGYREVNLNLGCPSGTVTAKGKGAGFLARPEELEAFLDAIDAAALPIATSVTTRLGRRREEEFSALLSTSGIPDPDLLIRTGKELRISNFLLWQAAYAELYFTDVLFPDFSDRELDKAIEAYSRRERRFGKV